MGESDPRRRPVKVSCIIAAGLTAFLAGSTGWGQEEGEDFLTALEEGLLDPGDVFHPEIRLVQEYDDNIALLSPAEAEGSWKTSLTPDLAFEFPGDQTAFALSYAPTFIYYYRKDGSWEINQAAAGEITHHLNPRWEATGREAFLRKEDPQDVEAPLDVAERTADFNQNDLELSLGRQFSRRLEGRIIYVNEWFGYDDPSLQSYLDRTGNDGELRLTGLLSPEAELMGSYRFRRVMYKTADLDYASHLLRGGIGYRIAQRLSSHLWTGYQFRDYDEGDTLDGPYVELALETTAIADTYLTFTGWYTIEDTYEETHRGCLEGGVKGTAAYNLTRRLTLTFNWLGRLRHYPSRLERSGPGVAENDAFWRLEGVASYEIRPHLFADLGYRYTSDNSDFENDSYFRNQTYLGFRWRP